MPNKARPVWVGTFSLNPIVRIAIVHYLLEIGISMFNILTKLASERRTLVGFWLTTFLFLNYIRKGNSVVHVHIGEGVYIKCWGVLFILVSYS